MIGAMVLDRCGQIALLEAVRNGPRSYSEARFSELLSRCGRADADARRQVLKCLDASQAHGEQAGLLARCGAHDAGAWDELIATLGKSLEHEIRTLNLIGRHLDGDSDASVELFRGIEPKIKGLLSFRIHKLTREDIQDLSQEIASKIFRQLPAYDLSKASFEAFWRIIVNQICVDHLRKITSQKRISPNDLRSINGSAEDAQPPDFAANGPGPDEVAATSEEFGLLHLALEKLGSFDSRCRRMFELFYFEECSYDDIAGLLKMNAKTVSTALVRCREKVRGFFPKEFREQAQRFCESVIQRGFASDPRQQDPRHKTKNLT